MSKKLWNVTLSHSFYEFCFGPAWSDLFRWSRLFTILTKISFVQKSQNAPTLYSLSAKSFRTPFWKNCFCARFVFIRVIYFQFLFVFFVMNGIGYFKNNNNKITLRKILVSVSTFLQPVLTCIRVCTTHIFPLRLINCWQVHSLSWTCVVLFLFSHLCFLLWT